MLQEEHRRFRTGRLNMERDFTIKHISGIYYLSVSRNYFHTYVISSESFENDTERTTEHQI